MTKPAAVCFTAWLLFCSACSRQQTVTAPYPLWGKPTYLNTAENDARRSMQLLKPASPDAIQGCLLIVHGMNEYVGRYGHVAEYFADRFIVLGMDLTAHGLSNPVLSKAHESIAAGATAYDASHAYLEQAQFRDLQSMRDDLASALHYLSDHCHLRASSPLTDGIHTIPDDRRASSRLASGIHTIPGDRRASSRLASGIHTIPGDRRASSRLASGIHTIPGDKPLPIFILSHSLGSLITASYLLQAENKAITTRIKGIVFSAPAFSVTEVPGWRGWFQNPLVRFSFHTHEHFLNPQDEPFPIMLFNQLLALISVPLQDGMIELLSLPGMRNLFSPTAPDWVSEYLTDSEEEKRRLSKDKYMIRQTVLRYVLAVEKEIIRFRRQMNHFDSPYLLIYSENDPITPAWGSIDFATATRQHHPHNRLVLLAGISHHEQLFSASPLREQILGLIDDWLRKRLKQE
ncbi:MAG: lysophospholipase [Methylobacter sp.]|uniref:serine aminopeptidase domain-containing protein n=1 Tax=Methylobacter sp. TaxID=2051955 RepID=UPI00258741F6|nr:alpha/beta hydrolase [Methylobacter sp.]MCL7421046.1 lysophospholipase [Methylobacter sp.]